MKRRLFSVFVALAALLAVSSIASAEIVFFKSGRAMSVKSHREVAGRMLLVVAGGGEIVCDPSLIDRISPDEMPPLPEPGDEAAAEAGQVPADYAKIIDAAAARHGVNPKLVRAVIQVESAYRPAARSRKGAIGLMQLMPETARRFSVANPYDPGANIEGGIKYLKFLLDRFDLSLALAAYNAGEKAVERFGGIPPYSETRNYVNAVLKLAR